MLSEFEPEKTCRGNGGLELFFYRGRLSWNAFCNGKIVVKYLSKGYNVELPFGSLPFSFSTPFGIHFFLFLGYNLCETWGDFMKKILIFGHKNPDTDSIVSSTALEFLKKKMGFEHYSACRAGHLTPQTDYIYK